MILTPATIKELKGPGRHRLGNGVFLLVSKGGSKSWVLRVTINGKRTDKGLGGWPKVSATEAMRKAAVIYDSIQATGRMPARNRRDVPSFQEVAEEVYTAYEPTWKSERHARNWRQSMRDYVYPSIGEHRLDKITSKQLLKLLLPIWTSKPETARRIRQRLRRVFEWAVDYEYTLSNPAASLKSLPKNSGGKKHFAAMPYGEMPEFLEALNDAVGSENVKLSLRLLILCASRTSEIRLATWQEIDLVEREWRIPAERMKMGEEHRVPLSSHAMNVLSQAGPGEAGYVFPSPRWGDKPISNMSMLRFVQERMGYATTVHGFRATFRTWAMEQTDAPWTVGETALAHSLGDSTVQAYARSDLFERRRQLMEEWAAYAMGENGVKAAA